MPNLRNTTINKKDIILIQLVYFKKYIKIKAFVL